MDVRREMERAEEERKVREAQRMEEEAAKQKEEQARKLREEVDRLEGEKKAREQQVSDEKERVAQLREREERKRREMLEKLERDRAREKRERERMKAKERTSRGPPRRAVKEEKVDRMEAGLVSQQKEEAKQLSVPSLVPDVTSTSAAASLVSHFLLKYECGRAYLCYPYMYIGFLSLIMFLLSDSLKFPLIVPDLQNIRRPSAAEQNLEEEASDSSASPELSTFIPEPIIKVG